MKIKPLFLSLSFCLVATLTLAQQPKPQEDALDQMMQQFQQQMKMMLKQMQVDTLNFPDLGSQNFGQQGGVIIIDGDTIQTFGNFNMPNFSFRDLENDFQKQQEEMLKQIPKLSPDNLNGFELKGLEDMMKQLQEMIPNMPLPDGSEQPQPQNSKKKKRKVIKI